MYLDLGDVRIDSICSGRFKLDGGAMFGVVPKALWSSRCPADADNRIDLSCNSLLVRYADALVVVETGCGLRFDDKEREFFALDESATLEAGLELLGVSPQEVTHVLLTHLHFDHAAGALSAAQGQIVATCPNAVHVVQQGEWKAAIEGRSIMKSSYRPDDLRLLHDQVGFQFTDGDEQLFPGLRVLVTGGHTVHHQAVVIDGENDCVVFAGDLLPTRHHLNPFWIMAYDMDPYQTFVEKQKLADKICDEGWIIAWDHDPAEPWNRLQRDGKRMLAMPVTQ
jgi:glyoxylase-like metal-dependent hydrolase (beta-lactamase superfamily II)